MKKTIIIFGNCQAQLMVACLDSIPFFQDQFEIIWEQNVENPAWPARKELLQSQIDNCAYLFEQLGRKDTAFPHKDRLPSECVIIRYPYLKLQCLWPLVSSDPRNKPEPPGYGAGRFPNGDRIIVDWLQKNISKEKMLDEYMNLNISHHVDLDQLYQSELQRIREVDDKCDIKVYNLIKEQFRTKKLFSSFSHPTDETLKVFLLEILEKSGLIDSNWRNKEIRETENHTLSDSIVIGVDTFFKQAKFDAVQVPIHPQVCEHFNLTWADGETRYQYYDYGDLTFKEYMQLYIDYVEPDTETVHKIKGLLSSENFEEANIALQQAIEKYPDSPDVLNVKGQFQFQTGNLEEATQTFLNVIERWPDHAEALNNLATIFCFKQDWEVAIKLLRKALQLSPSDKDILANLTFAQNNVLLSKALHFIEKGLLNDAQTALERILNSDKQNVEALNQLAIIQMKKGHFVDAVMNLALVLQLEPLNEIAAHNLEYLKQQKLIVRQ